MKNKRALEIDRRAKFCASSENPSVTNHLGGFCRDLEDNQRWKYDELSPVQLLEKLKLDEYPTDKGEFARAEFPAIGVPLLIIAAVVVATGIVRSVRWRRQYGLSIGRLIRHFGRSEHSTPSV